MVDHVRCITFDELLRRHDKSEIDLLQIDAEGYDFEILKTVDFARYRPKLVNYERVLLGEAEAACPTMLWDAGYPLYDYGQDTICRLRSFRL